MVSLTFRPPYPHQKAAGTPLDSMLSGPHSLYERNGEETRFTVVFGNLTPIPRYTYTHTHVFGNICTCILVIYVLVFTVMYYLYCVFVLFRLCIFILICFV